MVDLIPRIRQIWQTRRKQAVESAEQVVIALQQSVASSSRRLSTGPPIPDFLILTRSRPPTPTPDPLHLAWQQLSQNFDPVYGGFGTAPKVPYCPQPAVPAALSEALEQRPGPAHGRKDPPGHAPRRHLRPGRLRRASLLHRPAVARAALREDALRPGPAGHGLHRDLPGHPQAALRPDHPRDLHLRPARHDRPDRRVLLRRGRRQRRRRGQVLRLDRSRNPPGALRPGGRPLCRDL